MLIHRIKLQNVLSFGPDAQELELKPLNVLIGPNGSGKSNLIEVIGLLKAAPTDFATQISLGGGIQDWIWLGKPVPSAARLEVVIPDENGQQLRYKLAFGESHQRFQLIEERLELEPSKDEETSPFTFFECDKGQVKINRRGAHGEPDQDGSFSGGLNPHRSVFSQIKGPTYPELTYIGERLQEIGFFRECSFGPSAPVRQPQKTDLPNDFLMESGQNLGLMLNRLMQSSKVKQRILEALRELYEPVTDFSVNVQYGTIQVFIQEADVPIPATRLSDGTLRYLCLLCILFHPNPPPLVCIEEPELGLHPDILPGLAELLREASERCQLIITTHSDVLVDKLTDTPESVVICEKEDGQTRLQRLDKNELAHWLDKYRLGELWTSGEIGGNRW